MVSLDSPSSYADDDQEDDGDQADVPEEIEDGEIGK